MSTKNWRRNERGWRRWPSPNTTPGSGSAQANARADLGCPDDLDGFTEPLDAPRATSDTDGQPCIGRHAVVPEARLRRGRGGVGESDAGHGLVPEAREVVAVGDVERHLAEPAGVEVDGVVLAGRPLDQYLELEDPRAEHAAHGLDGGLRERLRSERLEHRSDTEAGRRLGDLARMVQRQHLIAGETARDADDVDGAELVVALQQRQAQPGHAALHRAVLQTGHERAIGGAQLVRTVDHDAPVGPDADVRAGLQDDGVADLVGEAQRIAQRGRDAGRRGREPAACPTRWRSGP